MRSFFVSSAVYLSNDGQVPRSSKKLHEDNEYILYTVVLFSRDADNFRTKARERGYQVSSFSFFPFFFFLCVCFFLLRTELIDQSAERPHFVNVSSQIRDFEYSPETQESLKQELEKLMQDQERFRSTLLQWCYTSYGEVNCFLKTIEILLSCLAI